MVKRLTPGRLKILMQKKGAAPPSEASKQWPPAAWTQKSCVVTAATVLNNHEVLGAFTPPATNSDPGGITPLIPLTYLGASGTSQNFLLGDGESGTDTNLLLPCTGTNKVLVYTLAAPSTTQALISASLPGGNTHIVMEVGARVELTWAPSGSNAYGGWSGFWGSSLMHSGCYSDCSVTPKAYLTESV